MFYTYDKFGWYEGTSEYRTTYSTHVKPTGDLKSGYQYNWYGDRWEYIQYVDPPDDPFIPEPPVPDTEITPMSFVRRFTVEEELKLRQEAKTDIVIDALLNNLLIVKYVDLADERVIGGIRYLVEKAFISQERADEILTAPVQPFEK